jgi:predicted nucleic acid-binding protein
VQAVVDPGVLIAAVIAPRGVCGQVLTAALDRRYTHVASPALLAELEEVLLRPKFRITA